MLHRKRELDDDRLLVPRSESSGKTRHLNPRSESTGAEAIGASAIGTSAIGSVVIGALAIGALAIGALAIGRLVIGRARIRRLEIDELVVRRLRITEELEVPVTKQSADVSEGGFNDQDDADQDHQPINDLVEALSVDAPHEPDARKR
jgi:hypothetical protein